MCLARHDIHFQLIPVPSARITRRPARTMQNPFIPTSGSNRHQVRSVFIRTKADEVSRAAPRTLHAMADAASHGSPSHQQRGIRATVSAQNPSPTLAKSMANHWTFADPNVAHWTFADLTPLHHRILIECGPKTSSLCRRVGYHRHAIPISPIANQSEINGSTSGMAYESRLASLFPGALVARSTLRRQVFYWSRWQQGVLPSDLPCTDGEGKELPVLRHRCRRGRSRIPSLPTLSP